MNEVIQELSWDSKFFGLKTGLVSKQVLDKEQLLEALDEAKKAHFKLLYWPARDRFEKLIGAQANHLDATLVDEKLTYYIDFSQTSVAHWSSDVVPYDSSFLLSDMQALAVQSGKYSRFAVDPKISQSKFEKLYTLWIEASISKKMAVEVLVLRDSGQTAGLVTLCNKDGVGDIGLLAVDQKFRGKGYGKRLIKAAQYWFVENGYNTGQVVTQSVNQAACSLYEKCGYKVGKREYYYHIWL